MTAPILVIGATGTVGRETVRQLTAAGHAVRALIRTPAKAADLTDPLVELVPGSLEDRPSLRKAFAGVDHVLLAVGEGEDFAALVSNFLTAARGAGTPHIAKISAMRAAVDSPSQLLRLHGQTDDLIIASGLQYTILRPSYFDQNLLTSAESIAGEGAFYLPFGEAAMGHIDVRDIAAVAVRALTEPGHAGRVYDLTGPEALTLAQVAEVLSDVLERPVRYVPITPEAARHHFLEAGLPKWHADGLVELMEFTAGGAHNIVTGEVAAILGRPPRSFADFARDHVEAIQGALVLH